MRSRLNLYLESGVLPDHPALSPEQGEAIVHAPADERSSAIAERLGVNFFAVQRYRAMTTGIVSTSVHWNCCTVCKQRFVTPFAARLMHPECRMRVDRRIGSRIAA